MHAPERFRPSLLLVLLLMGVMSAAAQSGQPNASYLRALAASPALPAVRYELDLSRPGTHLAGVTMIVPATGKTTTLEMPVWYPGRYSVYHFPANVQQTSAQCAVSGASLPATRNTPHSWVVTNGGCSSIRWQYRVYGRRPLNGSFFQLDAAHANLNGGPVFMYADGEKPNPVRLSIRLPEGWHVLNQLGQVDQAELWFPNYDIFIDSPTEAAPRLEVTSFREDGKTYRVLIHDFFASGGGDSANRSRLLKGLQAIVREENALIAPDDLDTYTFFFHFDRDGEDGMEHLFGTQIMIENPLASAEGLRDAEADAAHEFFHQWNIKRIRPVALGPWDYEAPNPTPSLWFGEGFTQYYGDITMERAGLQPRADYLRSLAASFGASLTQPGYRLMSAEASSVTAWFHDALPLLQGVNLANTSVSYYDRGEQLAAVLDLDVRARTHGQKTLDDVMRWLWTHTWRAPRATYYLPGRGYTEADLEQALHDTTGADYHQFFADYVGGTEALPYNQYLAAAGLQLACTTPSGVRSYSGAEETGEQVGSVAPGSPADRAGLGPAAMITAVDGHTSPPALNQLPPGQPVTVTATQHGAPLQVTLTPEPPRATSCQLRDLPSVTAEQKALRAAWLGPTR